MKTVAVLGLGIIGRIWAGHYQAAGVLAGSWNRTPQPDAPGATADLNSLVKRADLWHLVVADPAAVASVLDVIQGELGPGKLVVQSSTIDPESSEGFRARVTATGAAYLEAPFTGSKPAAEGKKTVFYLGGGDDVVAQALPLLSLISETRFHIGTNRQACALKLAMNLNIAVQMQGLVEALTLAREAGVSDDTFFQALQKNVSLSGVATLKEPKLRTQDFSPQFSVKHLLKDLRLASRTVGCREFPALDTVRERFHHAAEKGLADEDFSAIVKLM